MKTIFALVTAFSMISLSSTHAAAFRWTEKLRCSNVPVFADADGKTVGHDQVVLKKDSATGSFEVIEHLGGKATCTMVYFGDARMGRTEATALNCADWTNYDLPTFNAGQDYNFGFAVSAGEGGTWARSIRFDHGQFLLTAQTGTYSEDPNENTFGAKEAEKISCSLR